MKKYQCNDTFLETLRLHLEEAALHLSVQEAIDAIGQAQGTAYKGFMLGEYYKFSGYAAGEYPRQAVAAEDRDLFFRIKNYAYSYKATRDTDVDKGTLFEQSEDGITDRKLEACFLRLAGVDKEGVLHTLKMKMTFLVKYKDDSMENVYNIRREAGCRLTSMNVGQWEPMTKAMNIKLSLNTPNLAVWIQDTARIREILAAAKPWVPAWIDKCVSEDVVTIIRKRLNAEAMLYRYLYAPWMEILYKAGYAIAEEYFRGGDTSIPNSEFLRPGTKPSDIFTFDRWIYEWMKNEESLWKWKDLITYAKEEMTVDKNYVRAMLERGYSMIEIRYVDEILQYRHADGRGIFSFTSLTNYLARIDMHEAIERRDGLQYLRDYLETCQQLGMTPRTDSDSLKREHDVAARLLRQKVAEETAAARENGMAARREMMKDVIPILEYREETFFIRPIYDYETLIDEATQQHNCLACYAENIANGRSIILQMRETRHPEKSLISIEMEPDMRTIRQMFLASNQPIRNKSQKEFIERWQRHVRHGIGASRVIRVATEAA